MIFPCPWAPYTPTLCIISRIAQYLVHCTQKSIIIRLLTVIIPMGHAAGWGTFLPSLRFQKRSFLEVLDCVLKTLQKTNKQKKKKQNLKDKYIIIDEFAT